MLVEPNDMPPPYQGTSIFSFGRESLRRLSSTSVEMSSRRRPAGGDAGKAESHPVEAAAAAADLALADAGSGRGRSRPSATC